MGKYNIHAGHCPQGKGASGAVGLLTESTEARNVKNALIEYLKNEGHTVYDCTCNTAETQRGCLEKIVEKCNKHDVDLDVSIHFNSGRSDKKGDDKLGGFEIYATGYSGVKKTVADRIVNKMKKIGFTAHGDPTKTSSGLYYLNRTNSKALLLEICFVDDKDDAELYKKLGHKKIAKAIAEGILGKTIAEGNTETVAKKEEPKTEDKIETTVKETVKTEDPTNDAAIKVGSKVKIIKGSLYGGAAYGKRIPAKYIGIKKYTVKKIQMNTHGKIKVKEALIKELNSWIPVKYLD